MRFITTTVLLIVILNVSCAEKPEQERWEEVQFKVALRSEPYKRGDTYNSGEFEDLFSLSVPIRIKSGPGEAHVVKDGFWLHVAWENLVLNERLNQLGFEGFRRRIDNHFKSPYGTSWWDIGWQEMGDVSISTEWDIFQTPVGIASSDQDPRVWCKMWRWVKYSNKADIMLGKKRTSEPMDSANSDSADTTSE